jgi:hypothetical protein
MNMRHDLGQFKVAPEVARYFVADRAHRRSERQTGRFVRPDHLQARWSGLAKPPAPKPANLRAAILRRFAMAFGPYLGRAPPVTQHRITDSARWGRWARCADLVKKRGGVDTRISLTDVRNRADLAEEKKTAAD